MPIIETIIKDLQENHRTLIPQGAMDHLESVPADSAFTGSVFVAKTLVPTLFLKLSAKTATRIGLLPDEFYNPSYKFLTVEDQDGNTVSLVTLQQGEKRIMHAQLDLADRQVQEFIRLAKQQECFYLDVTVDHKKKPYGTTEIFEIDGEHLEWITRNLVRAANVKVANDWSRAANAYQSQQGFFSRGIFLSFRGGGNHQLHATSNTSFISRGDDDYEPDLDLAMRSVTSYELDWLASKHGVSLTDAPAMPVSRSSPKNWQNSRLAPFPQNSSGSWKRCLNSSLAVAK
ncbi:MAG: hypothetical protein ACI81P_003146 [Neolewinella sp.]|jgi:hypothetical protein